VPVGIDTLGAFGLCAEICDWQRFTKLAAWLKVDKEDQRVGFGSSR